MILGRPPAVQESYMTVELPTAIDMSLEDELGAQENKLVPGSIAHIKFDFALQGKERTWI